MMDSTTTSMFCDRLGELNHGTDYGCLMRDWSSNTFHEIAASAELLPIQTKAFMTQYAWEIFDKVFDYSLSATFSQMDSLLATVKLLGSCCRPRELYLMVTEKLAGATHTSEPSCLSVLLLAMQIALFDSSSSNFISDAFTLVLKAVTSGLHTVNEDAAEKVAKNASTQRSIKIALTFARGCAARSTEWLSDEIFPARVPRIDTVECSDMESYMDHQVVKFLLGVCAECVPCLENLSERSECVREVISIITGHTGIAIETILKHPYRLRSFMYTSLRHESEQEYGWGSVSDIDIDHTEELRSCITTPTGCADHVTRYIMCMTCLSDTASTEVKNVRYENNRKKRSSAVCGRHPQKEELISWEMVADSFVDASSSMPAFFLYPDAEDRIDEDCGGEMSLKREAAGKKKRLMLKKRMRHCGLDVPIPPADSERGQSEAVSVWSTLGVAMLAHNVLSSLCEYRHTDSSYSLPRVFSFSHLWNTFYPLALPLLRAQTLSAHEGLRVIIYLDSAIKSFREDLTTSLETEISAVPLLYLPQSMLSVKTPEDPLTRRGVGGSTSRHHQENELGSKTSEPHTLVHASYLLREVRRSYHSHRTPSKIHWTEAPAMLSGVFVARSADTLVLLKAVLNAMVLCSDNVERQSSLTCLRSLLSLLHPVSFLYMLEVLIRESPFPSVRGLLLDTLKWRSQACVSSASNKAASPIGDLTEVNVRQPSWPWLPLQPHSLSIDKASCSCSSNCRQGSFSCQDNRQQVLLLWRGPCSSIFFSSIVLQIFCIPCIVKIGNATTGQLLASADEFGGAINLLQHSALKMKGIIASHQRDLKSQFQELAAFLGWVAQTHCDCLLMDCVDSRARATADVRSFFYNDVQLAVELAVEGVKVKVLKIEKDLKSQCGFRSRSPWKPDRMCSDIAEEIPSCHSLSYDLLHLEVILDNLMFLLGVCQTLQVADSKFI